MEYTLPIKTVNDRIPTKYRTISNGHWDYLQYLTEESYFYFWKRSVWKHISKPYWDKFWGRSLSIGCDLYVNSMDNHIFHDFPKKWVYVEDYFKEAALVQQQLEDAANNALAEIEAKKNKIKYL